MVGAAFLSWLAPRLGCRAAGMAVGPFEQIVGQGKRCSQTSSHQRYQSLPLSTDLAKDVEPQLIAASLKLAKRSSGLFRIMLPVLREAAEFALHQSNWSIFLSIMIRPELFRQMTL